MAHPVGNQPPIVPPQQPGEPIRPPVPGGNGAAPTTLQPQAPEEIGYVATAVIFIKNWIVKLFSWICCCFKKEDEPPVPAEPAADNPRLGAVPPAQRPNAEQEPEVPQLQAGVQEDIDLLNGFRRLPEAAQNRIYIKIGQERSLHFMRWGDDLTYGKNQVQQNPKILLRFIVRPNH